MCLFNFRWEKKWHFPLGFSLITYLFLSYPLSLPRQLSLPAAFTLAVLLVGQHSLRAPVPLWLAPALSIALTGQSCFQAKSISPELWQKAWNGFWTQLYAFKSSSVLLRGLGIDSSRKNKGQPSSQGCSQQWVKASERQGLRAGTNIVFWKHELNILFLCALLEPAATPPTSARQIQCARAWAKDRSARSDVSAAATVAAATVPASQGLSSCPADRRPVLQLQIPAGMLSLVMQCKHLQCAGSGDGASQGCLHCSGSPACLCCPSLPPVSYRQCQCCYTQTTLTLSQDTIAGCVTFIT